MTLFLSPGAPRTAVYKFVRCNPKGDQANCVTQQSPEMAWNPDLPGKLPASAAQYLYVPMCCVRLIPSWSLASKAKPAEQELRDDHLLQL
uniref:Uncharacterized protein n=1 Tax=Seriola lalandi dorsalis TaxID=1841481 RepID=A0A3B4ZEH8_SERLL